ncbi:DUF6436 domain-containing protein [Rheinheimera maricola]|uniref:DUF6436 domain-containing protein n=1 Tax=Rheinheimera maricola TaxID=2793282 RepID=A0ABS7X894_9GAMM|nr:DUF6436 domain-containing protein [Rheinheimera maricola]
MVIFFCWIVLSSILLFYLGNRQVGTFAPNLDWGSSTLEIEALGVQPQSGFQLVHVFEKHCVCNRWAKAHITQLTEDLVLPTNSQYFINIEKLNDAGFVLPATPAVLIFSAGRLIYAGPYASGAHCAVEDSLIAPILKKKLILPGLWLNGNVNTCRCILS